MTNEKLVEELTLIEETLINHEQLILKDPFLYITSVKWAIGRIKHVKQELVKLEHQKAAEIIKPWESNDE